MDDLIGKTLGQYHIEAKIGRGGMATVFRAYQPSLERYIALKVLPTISTAQNPVFIKRFRREAHSVAQLNHPNILPIYDFGIDQNYSYIAMRYVEKAHTLDSVIARFPRLEQNLELIGQVASALSYAHQRGIIHRDVKPSNILIDGNWALLSDFGVAKIEKSVSTRLTETGSSFGTAAYMAPEQARGQPTDHRADIYALGVVVYEILTRKVPHDADSALAIMLKRTTEAPQPPRELNPNIPANLDRVVLRALAIDPDERFNSAVEFANALKHVVTVHGSLRNTSPLADQQHLLELAQPAVNSKPVTRVSHNLAAIDLSSVSTPQPQKSTKSWPHSVWLAVAGSILVVGLLLWGSHGAVSSTAPPIETPTTSIAAMAPTSTPSPTTTPTPQPTDTPTPPPTPTSTPAALLPAVTPIERLLRPTQTPIITPTLTGPTATPTKTSTPTPSLPNGVPILLKPLSVDEEPSFGPTIFEWQWQGELPPEFGFEVRVWRAEEPPAGVHDAVLDNQQGRVEKIGPNRYRLRIDISEAAGVRGRTGLYLWTVVVVQINPEYVDLGLAAEPALLRFEAGGSGGDKDNGGDQNAGGGIS